MTRLRTSLPLLALAALLLAAAPVFAATCDSSQPSRAAAPVCTEPAASGPAVGLASIIIPPDFILCTCDFCKVNPYVECQISPSGYSILCADYSRLHNCK